LKKKYIILNNAAEKMGLPFHEPVAEESKESGYYHVRGNTINLENKIKEHGLIQYIKSNGTAFIGTKEDLFHGKP
jgi:hypothetical protein